MVEILKERALASLSTLEKYFENTSEPVCIYRKAISKDRALNYHVFLYAHCRLLSLVHNNKNVDLSAIQI